MIKKVILEKQEFYKKFILVEKENTFFNELKNVLKSNTNKIVAQKEIEKLVNIYYIEGDEKKIDINPFWKSYIHLIFNLEINNFYNDYKELMELYIFRLKKKSHLFEIKKKNYDDLFNHEEIFILFIINFIETLNMKRIKLKNESDNKGINQVVERTFLESIKNKCIGFYDFRLKVYYLKIYLKEKDGYSFQKFEDDSNLLTEKLSKIKDDNICLDYKILLINYLKKEKENDVFSLYNMYENDFLEKYNKHKNNNMSDFFSIFTMHIHKFFIETNLFKRVLDRTSYNKSYAYMEFANLEYFNKLNIICHIVSRLPMIVRPRNWDSVGRNGGYYFKSTLGSDNKIDIKIKKGLSNFSSSKKTLGIINILQKKIYKINKEYLNYAKTEWFKYLYDIPYNWENIYNYSYKNYIKATNKHKDLLKYNNITSNDIGLYIRELAIERNNLFEDNDLKENKGLILDRLRIKLLDKYSLNEVILNSYKDLFIKKGIFFKELNIYNEHNYILNFCDIFKDESLYNVTRLDFRGRLSPLGRLSRASGRYKYLLDDKKYYMNEESLLILKEYLGKFLIKNKNFTRIDLINYFNNYFNNYFEKYIINYKLLYKIFIELSCNNKLQSNFSLDLALQKIDKDISLSNKDKILYNDCILDLYIILTELKEEKRYLFLFGLINFFGYMWKGNKFKTSFTIEIDQNASGPQIYSLLSSDKKLCNITNLFLNKKKEKKDIYLDFLKSYKKELLKYYRDNIKNNYHGKIYNNELKEKVIKTIDSDPIFDRKFAKGIIIPKFYSMGDKGLKKILYKLNINLEKESLRIFVNDILNIINNILQKKFNKTLIYQNLLIELIKILFKVNIRINLLTFDGSLLWYEYLTIKEKFSKIYRNGKPISFRVYTKGDDNSTYSYQFYTTFPVNFIHSLDGSLCRIIIDIFYKEKKYILEPLHDSFRIPLIYFNCLRNIIKYIYSYFFFNKYFNKLNLNIIKDENNNIKLILYDKNYKKKMDEYFKDIKFTDNIIYDLFLSQLSLNSDVKKLLDDQIKVIKKKYPNNINRNDFLNFIDNEFMFYF
jgi:hypothetical protein